MLKNLRRASVFMFTRRQTLYVNPKTLNPKTLKPQTLKPWKLWIRKQKTLRICSIYCNLSSHVRRQGILNVAVRESVRNIIYCMCIYIYIFDVNFIKRKHQPGFIREERNISGLRSTAWPGLSPVRQTCPSTKRKPWGLRQDRSGKGSRMI